MRRWKWEGYKDRRWCFKSADFALCIVCKLHLQHFLELSQHSQLLTGEGKRDRMFVWTAQDRAVNSYGARATTPKWLKTQCSLSHIMWDTRMYGKCEGPGVSAVPTEKFINWMKKTLSDRTKRKPSNTTSWLPPLPQREVALLDPLNQNFIYLFIYFEVEVIEVRLSLPSVDTKTLHFRHFRTCILWSQMLLIKKNLLTFYSVLFFYHSVFIHLFYPQNLVSALCVGSAILGVINLSLYYLLWWTQ